MAIIITSITKDEEDKIDNGKTVALTRGDMHFDIKLDNIEYYGKINFNKDSNDINIIKTSNWFSISKQSAVIPANYDYENHCAYSDISSYKWFDTIQPELVARYGHGMIGKPERCVIFKHYYK